MSKILTNKGDSQADSGLVFVERKGDVEIFHKDFAVQKSSKSNFQLLDGLKPVPSVKGVAVPGVPGKKYIPWGSTNALPRAYTEMIYSNHIAPRLLETRRDQVMGQGLFFYRQTVTAEAVQKIEVVDLPEGKAWLMTNEVRDTLKQLEMNRNQIGNAFLLVELDASGANVFPTSVRSLDAHMVRAEEADLETGKIAAYYVCRDWSLSTQKKVRVAAFDPANPQGNMKFIVHLRDKIPGFPYYDPPAWIGATTAIQVSNLFWSYYFSRIDKAYALRYLIRIDWSSFEAGYDPAENDNKTIKEAKKEFVDKINDYLKGTDGATTLYTGFTSNGQERLPMVTVEVLAKAAGDDLYLELAKQADVALASGFGIDPALANVATGSGLGRSGSELRISFQVDLAMHCQQPRQLILKAFNWILKPMFNWWPEDVYLGIEDVDITTIADNPTGREKVATPSV
jgi:hypothetical protein